MGSTNQIYGSGKKHSSGIRPTPNRVPGGNVGGEAPGTAGVPSQHPYFQGIDPRTGKPRSAAAEFNTVDYLTNRNYNDNLQQDGLWYRTQYALDPGGSSGTLPTIPSSYPTAPGGGSRSGGGGGGGSAYLSADRSNALLDLIRGFKPQSYAFEDATYDPYELDAAMYDEMRKRIKQALAADSGQVRDVYGGARDALGALNQSSYDRNFASTPQVRNSMERLLGAGSGAVDDVISEENAYSMNSDGAFANLLSVLGGVERSGQQSRMSELEMDQVTSLLGLGADARGMQAGVDVGQMGAQQQADMLNHQGRNEVSRYNNQGRNAASQQNVATGNDSSWQTIQALLALIPSLDASVLSKIGA